MADSRQTGQENTARRFSTHSVRGWLRRNRDLAKAYSIFVVFTIAAFVFVLTPWGDQFVLEPLNVATAAASAWLINLLGTDASAVGTQIVSSIGGVNIKEGCNSVYATIIFLAGIVAFPTSLKKRLFGAILGTVALFVINLIRVVTLFFLSGSDKALFDEAHLYIWQFAIIIIGGLLWLLWYDKVVMRKAKPAATDL